MNHNLTTGVSVFGKVFSTLGLWTGFRQIARVKKSPILVTCALPEELSPLIRRLRERKRLICGGRILTGGFLDGRGAGVGVTVLATGMGREIARRALTDVLKECAPALLIISGTAGALTGEAQPGDMLISSNHGEESMREKALQITREALGTGKVWHEPIHSVQMVIADAEGKTALSRRTGAFAVDMESDLLAQVARESGVPHMVVRVVSDGLHDRMPLPFERFMTSDGFLSLPRMILYLLVRPWKIPALIRFGGQAQRACRELAKVLEKLLPACA